MKRPLCHFCPLLVLAATAIATSAANAKTTNITQQTPLLRGAIANTTALRASLELKAAQYARNLSVISSDDSVRRTPFEVEVEGEATIPSDIGHVNSTFFGGISGIAYDDDRKVYYAITNDAIDLRPRNTTNSTNVTLSDLVDDEDSISDVLKAVEAGSTTSGGDGGTRNRQLEDLLEGWSHLVGETPSPTPAPSSSSTAPTHLDSRRPRFYTLEVEDGDAKILDVTYLSDAQGQPYGVGVVQPQAIVYCDGQIIISLDVGPNAPNTTKPEIAEFNRTGHYQSNFTYPDYFELAPGGFTALSVNPNEEILYAATGRGMINDQPNYIRITEFNLDTRQSGRQYVYETDETVVGMVSLDENGGFAVLERSDAIPEYHPYYTADLPTTTTTTTFSTTASVSRMEEEPMTVWEGYDVTLYYAITLDALNVETVTSLADVSSLPTIKRDNIYEWKNTSKFEAMGPDGDGPDRRRHKSRKQHRSPKSHRSRSHRELTDWKTEIDLIIMSDNEFTQFPTEILMVELDLYETPILKPDEQTDEVLGEGNTGLTAVDPAIWVHPDKSEDSLILGALSNSAIGVYDLEGELVQQIGAGGKAMGIDVVYAFQLTDSELIDIALVTDGTHNRVNAFRIRKDEEKDVLWGMTEGMPTINNPTAISTYHSPFTGKQYAFVVSNGDHIRQLELQANNDRVGGTIVREFGLPSPAGGLVVDTELGFLYVSLKDDKEKGILKYDAEPDEFEDHSNYPQTVVNGDEEYFRENDIEGMTLYYGDQGDGYLVVSVSGDSTFAVFEREQDNEYYDSFTIGANRDKGIDKTDNTEGIAITNVRLGSDFKCGVFVVQDFDNEVVKVDEINANNNPYATNSGTAELVNSNTNFKLVPFEELADNLYYYLDVDTDSWNPRRFSLVIWMNCLAQSIYYAAHVDRVSGRDTERLLGYINNAVKHLYPRSAKKQQMISLINPFDTDVHRRRLDMTLEERRQQTRRLLKDDENMTKEERRELKKRDCDKRRHLKPRSVNTEDAKDAIKDLIEHLERLKWDARLADEDFNTWRGLAEAIRDNIPDEA